MQRDYSPYRAQFAIRLRAVRKARRLSLQAIARHVGVSHPLVHAWETAKCMPNPAQFVHLTEALGVSMDGLLRGFQEDDQFVPSLTIAIRPGEFLSPEADAAHRAQEAAALAVKRQAEAEKEAAKKERAVVTRMNRQIAIAKARAAIPRKRVGAINSLHSALSRRDDPEASVAQYCLVCKTVEIGRWGFCDACNPASALAGLSDSEK